MDLLKILQIGLRVENNQRRQQEANTAFVCPDARTTAVVSVLLG